MILNTILDNPITFYIVGGINKPTENLPKDNDEGVLLWIESNHYDDFKYSSYFINQDNTPTKRVDGTNLQINDVWVKTTSERKIINGEVNLLEIRNSANRYQTYETEYLKQSFFYVAEIWVYKNEGWTNMKAALWSEREGSTPAWYDFENEIILPNMSQVDFGNYSNVSWNLSDKSSVKFNLYFESSYGRWTGNGYCEGGDSYCYLELKNGHRIELHHLIIAGGTSNRASINKEVTLDLSLYSKDAKSFIRLISFDYFRWNPATGMYDSTSSTLSNAIAK